jgi:lysophospholipase L1-like esterase
MEMANGPLKSKKARKSKTGIGRTRWSFRLLTFVTVLFFFSLIADRGLAILGYSAELSLPVSHPPNHHDTHKYLEYDYTLDTNRQGLRYPEIALAKPAGEYRMFVVGDSFTEGMGVEAAQAFSALLEQRLASAGGKVRFINGGLSGTGPYEYGRLFIHQGLEYGPDALLICLYANDVSNTRAGLTRQSLYQPEAAPRGLGRVWHGLWPHAYTALWKRRRAAEITALTRPSDFVAEVEKKALDRGVPLPEIIRWKARLPADLVAAVNRGELPGALLGNGLVDPGYWTDAIDLSPEHGQPKFQAMLELLEEMVSVARKRNIKAGLIFLPCKFMCDPASFDPARREPWRESGVNLRPEWLNQDTAIQRELRTWAEKNQLPFLDLTPAFRAAASGDDRLYYEIDDHFTAAGHRLAAAAMVPWLIEAGLAPGPKPADRR